MSIIFKLTGIEKLKTLTFVMKKINKAYRLLNSNFSKLLKRESNKWDPEKNWRIPSVCYTLEHKIAYLACEYYFLGKYSLRGIFHDWEKPWMYIFPWLNEDEIKNIHRKNSPHHVEANKVSSIEHLVEMYMDWECAAITKPDKPLNAFETLLHYYPDQIKYLLPICLVFNVDSIKSNVWLHQWHCLAKDDKKNTEIFTALLNTLEQINNVSYCQELAINLKEANTKGKKITQFSSAEIFILTLLWHSEKMKFDIDYTKVKSILMKVYSDMKEHTYFTHSGILGAINNFNGVKSSIYSK